jgi:hypothetical protein
MLAVLLTSSLLCMLSDCVADHVMGSMSLSRCLVRCFSDCVVGVADSVVGVADCVVHCFSDCLIDVAVCVIDSLTVSSIVSLTLSSVSLTLSSVSLSVSSSALTVAACRGRASRCTSSSGCAAPQPQRWILPRGAGRSCRVRRTLTRLRRTRARLRHARARVWRSSSVRRAWSCIRHRRAACVRRCACRRRRGCRRSAGVVGLSRVHVHQRDPRCREVRRV